MLEDAYEIKTQMIGPEGDKIGKVLNRVRMCDARQALHKGMVEDAVDHSKVLQ